MKIGDIVRRKDVPRFKYKVVRRNTVHKAWNVVRITGERGLRKAGMIFDDDDRWEVV